MIVSSGKSLALPFAPQALAEVSPIASSTGYFYADAGLELLNKYALYGELYRAQPWVFTVVDKLAKAGARLKFNTWDVSGKFKVLDTGRYAAFWRRPCPTMPTYRFWHWTFSTYNTYGEAFWVKVRRDGPGTKSPVLGVLPMHPTRTIIERDKDTGRLVYRFTLGVANAGILEVDEADVVPFLTYNPDNVMRGLSKLEPLRSTLYNEDAARRANESFWRRGARPGIMVSAPNTLSDTAYGRLKAAIDSTHGGADNAGGTLVLEEGAKPVPVTLNAEEMEYIEGRKLNREEVCGVFDMPPPVVHILDHATFSNITEQSRMLYRDTMAPLLEDVESTIEHYLTPDFGPVDQLEGRFNLDDVLRGDFETRATAVGGLVQVGVMKPSEARPLFDLPDAGPVADRLYANATIQPLGEPAERISYTVGTRTDPVPATPGEEQARAEVDAERADEPGRPPVQDEGKEAAQ